MNAEYSPVGADRVRDTAPGRGIAVANTIRSYQAKP
jgi:hypothetical protein